MAFRAWRKKRDPITRDRGFPDLVKVYWFEFFSAVDNRICDFFYNKMMENIFANKKQSFDAGIRTWDPQVMELGALSRSCVTL